MTLLHVLEQPRGKPHGVPTDPFDWQLRREEAAAYLDRVASDPRLSGLRTGIELQEGLAPELIQAWTTAHRVDLTVISSHGEAGHTRWGLASVARKLIEGVEGSLLVVPASAAAGWDEKEVRYERVLVPLDGSPRAEGVLPVARSIAEAHGAELVLVHVLAPPSLLNTGPPGAADLELTEQLARHDERAAEEYLGRRRAQLAAEGFRVRSLLIRAADARDALPRAAERERADLVVISAHGASGRTDCPFGSVTAHLVTTCPVPLLILRPPGGRPRSWQHPRHSRPRAAALSAA